MTRRRALAISIWFTIGVAVMAWRGDAGVRAERLRHNLEYHAVAPDGAAGTYDFAQAAISQRPPPAVF